MPDLKISQLTLEAAPTTSDVLPIVDDSSSTTKKVTIGSLPITTATQSALTPLQTLATNTNGLFGVSYARTTNTSTGTVNNLAVTTAWIEFTAAGSSTLTGLVAQADGFEVTISNRKSGTNTLRFVHEGGTSTAGNRFNLTVDIYLRPGDSIKLKYNTTSARWIAATNVNLGSLYGHGVLAVSYNPTLGRILWYPNGTDISVDWGNSRLIKNGATKYDWSLNVWYDNSSGFLLDAQNRIFYNTVTNIAIDFHESSVFLKFSNTDLVSWSGANPGLAGLIIGSDGSFGFSNYGTVSWGFLSSGLVKAYSIGEFGGTMGFFGYSAPQADSGITGATFTVGALSSITEDSTFDGYTVGQIVATLKSYGLLL